MHSNQAAENGILDTTSTTFGGSTMTTRIKNRSTIFDTGRKLAVSALALGLALGSSAPAWATIDNTVTATGTTPAGGTLTPAATENVDVENAAPAIVVTKNRSLADTVIANTLGDAGEVITYLYTVENTGNTTLVTAGVVDTHDGSTPIGTPTFASWSNQAGSPAATVGDATITLAPGAIAEFELTYTITTDDIFGGGGTGVGLTVDNDLDNSAQATSQYFNGVTNTPVNSAASLQFVALNIDPQLAVTKVATFDLGAGVVTADGTTDNVPEGTVITYTYTVTNPGNVPITGITLGDVHNGTGTVPTPTFSSFTTNNSNGPSYTSANAGNTITTLYPGDVAVYTATYTVTQTDVDTLQ